MKAATWVLGATEMAWGQIGGNAQWANRAPRQPGLASIFLGTSRRHASCARLLFPLSLSLCLRLALLSVGDVYYCSNTFLMRLIYFACARIAFQRSPVLDPRCSCTSARAQCQCLSRFHQQARNGSRVARARPRGQPAVGAGFPPPPNMLHIRLLRDARTMYVHRRCSLHTHTAKQSRIVRAHVRACALRSALHMRED